MYPNGANSSSLQGSSAALHTAKNVQPALRRIGKTLYHPPAARLPRQDVSRATHPILTVSYASELNRNVIVKLADILTSSAALPNPAKVRILPLPQRPKAKAFFIFEDSGEDIQTGSAFASSRVLSHSLPTIIPFSYSNAASSTEISVINPAPSLRARFALRNPLVFQPHVISTAGQRRSP